MSTKIENQLKAGGPAPPAPAPFRPSLSDFDPPAPAPVPFRPSITDFSHHQHLDGINFND